MNNNTSVVTPANPAQAFVNPILSNTVTWSNADLKAPNPLTILAAQGPGTVIVPISIIMKLHYGGNNPFATFPISFTYTLGGNATTTTASFDLTKSANTYYEFCFVNFGSSGKQDTLVENAAATLVMNLALTGNAANDNYVTVTFTYYVVKI